MMLTPPYPARLLTVAAVVALAAATTGCINGTLTSGTDTDPDVGETGPGTPKDTGTPPQDSTVPDTRTSPDTGIVQPRDTGGGAEETGTADTSQPSEDTQTTEDTSVSLPDINYDQECPDGPLDKPKPNCSPSPLPDTGSKYADCVARINQYRLECQCLPPLERWKAGEDCADQMAKYDAMQGKAHAGFRAGICNPRGRAQNECPGYPGSTSRIFSTCFQQMWDEGPGEDFQKHGHYLNMASEGHSKVACGFHSGGRGIWAVQNFR